MSCFKQWWGTMRTEPLRLQPASDSGAPNSLTSSHTFQFEFIFLLWPKMMFATITEVKGIKTAFTIQPAKGGYKLAFGDAEFIAYFKEMLRPQLVEMLF